MLNIKNCDFICWDKQTSVVKANVPYSMKRQTVWKKILNNSVT